MRITATNKIGGGKLELSSLGRLEDKDALEGETFHVVLTIGESIVVEDKWYDLLSIQNALKGGYIVISDYYKQSPHAVEISTATSTTNSYGFTTVEILNRSLYPQEPFTQINANFELLDSTLANTASNVASLQYENTTVTNNYVATSMNGVILCNASSSAILVELPPVSLNSLYRVKKIDESSNIVTISGNNSSETIDTEESVHLLKPYESYTMTCDGSVWWIV